EMHQAIEKLSDEWNRVFQIAATVRASTAQHDFFMPLIQTAAEDIGLQNAEGYTDFLVSFKYAPHILSLGVPVFNLHTPWELSVIWHEMAGRKVRDMKEKDPDVFQRLIPSSYNPPAETSPEQDEGASDGDIQVGWTVGWMEELFEDGCSVLAFEDAFLPIFKNILFRYSNAVDSRHPRMNVRLAMAIMLLRLSQLDEVIEETRAKDILVASDEKYPGLGLKELAESEAEIILEAANAIHAKLAEECPGLKELTESKARDTILKAMEDYSALPKEGDDHVAISDIITKTESTLKELIRERQTSKDEPDVEALVKSL
ncbi:hypothetical protein GWN63_05015, partial [Candidatus Bathyarchaeota archaeon]|nr:hypothetical protein [Candidatus Bathyarchaeota archaeon]NIU81587.1 hypothetical protein [Candidatus Bathyarchaeota archaeon]